jgi:hypothetical protein
VIEDDDVTAKRKAAQDGKDLVKSKQARDLKVLLKSPEFRRFCWRLWGECGVFQGEPYVPNSDQTQYNLGVRSVGKDLLVEVMQAEPAIFSTIQREALSVPNQGV